MSDQTYDYDFGTLTHYTDKDRSNKVTRIGGVSKNNPTFIGEIDRNLWNDHWKIKSESLGVNYMCNQDYFYIDNKSFPPWTSEKIEELDKNMVELIESYNQFVIKYNEDIATPLIKERKGLLEQILTQK